MIFNVKNDFKISKKGVYIRVGPRGCDVALRATWQCHAGPRERLRGADVTYTLYIDYLGL